MSTSAEYQKEWRKNNPGRHYISNKNWRYNRPDLRQRQNKTYRLKHGAFVRGGHRWSTEDVQLILSKTMSDVELGEKLNRSVEAIQNKRSKVKTGLSSR